MTQGKRKTVTVAATRRNKREPSRECPAVIKEAIETIRRVRADRAWPDLASVDAAATSVLDGEREEQILEVLRIHLPELPLAAWAETSKKPTELLYVWDTYRRLFMLRQILTDIAERAKGLDSAPESDFYRGLIEQSPGFQVHLVIDPQTRKIRMDSSEQEILEALFDLDARDLRVCSACKKLFWSQRKNVARCSDRCTSNARQKRKRERDRQADQEFRASQKAAGLKLGRRQK